MPTNWVRLAVAEAIGTFALVFVAVLAASTGVVGSALAYGLVVAVMVATLGHVSGAHLNPAVTLGFVVTRRMNLPAAAVYWVAQLSGALLAGVLLVVATSRDAVAAGTPVPAGGASVGAVLVLELVATFFLVLVVFGTAVDGAAPRSVYPFAIGLAVAAGALAIGPITGGALNPARWFGPGLASWTWSGFVAYWVGPLVGGALGALTYRWLTSAGAVQQAVDEVYDQHLAEPVGSGRR